MSEIITEALVIDKENIREYDSRVFLYSKSHGGITAKATSLRKITSKMSGHLEPLNFVEVRLVQKKNSGGALYQIADALTLDASGYWRESQTALQRGLSLISIFKEYGFQNNPDEHIYDTLSEIFKNPPTEAFAAYSRKILEALGFDARYAACVLCNSGLPYAFFFNNLEFYCRYCAPQEFSSTLKYYV